MDVQPKLDELVALVTNAKSVPLSSSVMVNKAELNALVEELRVGLPEELAKAEQVIRKREQVVAEGRQEAEKIIAAAHEEQHRLVSRTEVTHAAQREADRVLAEANETAAKSRREVEDYVDTKLANFEVVLTKTLAAVHRGRDKIRGRNEEELRKLSERDLDDTGELLTPLPE